VTVNYEVLAEMDCRIEDATAARLLKEAIDDRDRTKAGLQAQIDNLQAENAKAWQAVADVDRKHADAVSEARRVIADWEADRNAIILKINCRQQEAQDLAAQREKVGYVDHVAHLKMRRQIDRERKREADLRHEAGQYKTTEELQFTDADRHSALNPKVGDDDVKYRAIGLPP
jgi:hypothetical protein